MHLDATILLCTFLSHLKKKKTSELATQSLLITTTTFVMINQDNQQTNYLIYILFKMKLVLCTENPPAVRRVFCSALHMGVSLLINNITISLSMV